MYADLGRPPLPVAGLDRGGLGPTWSRVQVVRATGSTNADLARAAREGAPQGLVLVAEEQLAGRGRLQRTWVSPARAGLTLSVLLRPAAPRASWGWLPLLTGVALAEAVAEVARVPTFLKWPNDLLAGASRAKAAGILAEVVEDAVVIGAGLNVSHTADELPPGATSLALAGSATADRVPLLRAFLRGLDRWYRVFGAADGDAVGCGLLAAYLGLCDTVDREVRVALPAGELRGRAEGVDSTGRLLVRGATGVQAVAAGDVTHVRPV